MYKITIEKVTDLEDGKYPKREEIFSYWTDYLKVPELVKQVLECSKQETTVAGLPAYVYTGGQIPE